MNYPGISAYLFAIASASSPLALTSDIKDNDDEPLPGNQSAIESCLEVE